MTVLGSETSIAAEGAGGAGVLQPANNGHPVPKPDEELIRVFIVGVKQRQGSYPSPARCD